MDQLQQDQLHVMLRALLGRLQALEGAMGQALGKTKDLDDQAWDLYAQLVEHDHCELCGRAVWGLDHTC